jgi:hypothetical protein
MKNRWADTLAGRLGVNVHVSSLDFKLERLMSRYPSPGAVFVEDWLVDVANARGATVVRRIPELGRFRGPDRAEFPDEELIVALCRLQGLDRPQILRLAGQLISRGEVDVITLLAKARQERVEMVLHEMARQALMVEPDHKVWSELRDKLPGTHARDPVIHWSRLAWPIMSARGCNADKWVLVK